MLVRHRAPVALAWLLTTGFLWSAGRDLEQVLEVGATVRGSESDAVRHIIGTKLPGAGVEYAVLVIQGLDPKHRDDHQQLLDTIAGAVGRVPGIELLRYSRDSGDTVLAPFGGALVLAALAPDADPDLTIRALRRVRDSLALTLPDSLAMTWTGEAAINTDLRRASAHDANRAEWRALPLSLLILVLAFGAIVAAGVPLTIGGLTIVCSLGLAGLVGRAVPLSLMLQSVVTMIGLGLGIDYGLLMVSRFREGLRNGLPATAAAAEAGETAGATIAVSAAAVFIGFAALVVIPLGELRSVGFGGLLAVLFAAALASTLVPYVLAWLGPRIDALPVQRRTAHKVSPYGANIAKNIMTSSKWP